MTPAWSRRARQGAVLAAVAVAAFLAGARFGGRRGASLPTSPPPQARIVEDVLAAIRAFYVDSVDDAELEYRAAQGIVQRLEDPYASVRGTRERYEAALEARATGGAELLSDSVGYIALRVLGATASAELRDTVAAFQARGLRALILDLRDNRGGYVSEAVNVADLFLDPDQPIGSLKGRSQQVTKRYLARAPQSWPDLPLVILINEGTMSSAELIAGALQEHDRAVLLGASTFGKGVAQVTIPIGDTLTLSLTAARWYTPSGRSLDRGGRGGIGGTAEFFSDRGRPMSQGGGIVPDLAVPRDGTADRPLQAALELVRRARTTAALLDSAAAWAAAPPP